MRCTALDDAQMNPRARLIVLAMARSLAGDGACPTYEAPDLYPDCYRAADLPAVEVGALEAVVVGMSHMRSQQP